MWFFFALSGLAVSVVLSVALAVAFEGLASIGMRHAAMGGFSIFILAPMALVFEFVGLLIGFLMGAAGWNLFLSPIYGCLVMYGGLTVMWLISSQSND